MLLRNALNLSLRAATLLHRQQGAIGWLVIGILVGVGLVVFGIIKFLIPGE